MDRIDVTQRRIEECQWAPGDRASAIRKVAPAKALSQTEQAILTRFSGETNLGWISKPLLYSQPLQYLGANDRKALFKLLMRGNLHVYQISDATGTSEVLAA